MPLYILLLGASAIGVYTSDKLSRGTKIGDFLGPPNPFENVGNSQSELDKPSFIDNLSLKESLIGLTGLTILFFSKPWK